MLGDARCMCPKITERLRGMPLLLSGITRTGILISETSIEELDV